jgi:hypothetical protein
MAYRGLRNISLTFATTLRMRAGQNDLQIRPRAIWRDKNKSTEGTDNDQSQQREYSEQDRPHAGLLFDHTVGAPSRPVRTRVPAFKMLTKVNLSCSFNVIEAPAATSPTTYQGRRPNPRAVVGHIPSRTEVFSGPGRVHRSVQLPASAALFGNSRQPLLGLDGDAL